MIYDYLCVETPLPERADAIVVGGSYSWTDMADRAAQLYLRGAPLLIVSGFAQSGFSNEAQSV